jgi:hypothetical protein
MRASGRDAESIKAELHRSWRGHVPDHVLDDVARLIVA